MLINVINVFNLLDTFFWGYLGFIIIIVLGLILSFRMRFFQIFRFGKIIKVFFEILNDKQAKNKGIHPLKIFFSSVGGMIGIGNIIGIITAVQIGGPGALFWVWIAVPIGGIIKYSEIFLGLKYRKETANGYDGGPMFFLKEAFKNKWMPIISCVLLCIYGVEIYQFKVVTDSIVENFNVHPYLVIFPLLAMILYAGFGGIPRLAKICSSIMPFFILVYISICIFIITLNISSVPLILKTIFSSAFTGHAATGGFAGASIVIAIKQGFSRAIYSGDIGIGYDSIIQSESSISSPGKQGQLAIVNLLIDNIICTLSILVVLFSNCWTLDANISGTSLAKEAFSKYMPFVDIFMPILLFITGYTTIIAYFCIGIKCAKYISPKYGTTFYYIYAICSFILFSFTDQSTVLLIMSLSGAGLVLINSIGIFLLRKKITGPYEYSYEEEYVK